MQIPSRHTIGLTTQKDDLVRHSATQLPPILAREKIESRKSDEQLLSSIGSTNAPALETALVDKAARYPTGRKIAARGSRNRIAVEIEIETGSTSGKESVRKNVEQDPHKVLNIGLIRKKKNTIAIAEEVIQSETK